MKAVAAHLKLNRNMSDRQVASFLSVGAEDTPILVGLGDGSTQPLPPLSATAVQRAVSQVRTSGHMKPVEGQHVLLDPKRVSSRVATTAAGS
eukprot:CAMPEP_0114130320 /NCGR_PEP_ID=MMETSP0043_2-20121206/11956_1 /TAXON_ID=464988 /ORGANISM="Hemiselmis andersenii, Strain CCMP644" /LENGTH=91 /DNA_ID=CAMNT_0001223675 /DNA_START=395 /DNA_END=671 /DNA_ORIENTATION=-